VFVDNLWLKHFKREKPLYYYCYHRPKKFSGADYKLVTRIYVPHIRPSLSV